MKPGLQVDQLHLTESLTRLGGVETLVQQLLRGGEGIYAAGLLDSSYTGISRGVGLRAGKHAGAFMVRKSACAHFSHVKHLIFHNFAGMMMLSSVLPHQRKSLFLHTNSPDVFALLPLRLPFLDSIFVSGDDLEREIREKFPQIQLPITALEYPLDDRFFHPCERSPKPFLTIGYSGRLEIEQKQVRRLVELCDALNTLSVPFRLEIAGSGSAKADLQKELSTTTCHFLGTLDPKALHEAYQRWDFLICTSDYETGPLVALEAMATGTIPILPNVPCQATALLGNLQALIYPVGDMKAASERIQSLSSLESLSELRSKLIAKVADRRLPRFVEKINTTLSEVGNRPALGDTPPTPRGLAEFLPFALRRSGNDYLR